MKLMVKDELCNFNMSICLLAKSNIYVFENAQFKVLSMRLLFTFTNISVLIYPLRIIPTPWEVTLSRLLSIVSDFEREGHLKYKLA